MSEAADRAWLFGGYPGRVLASLSLTMLVLVTGQLLLPPLLPVIIADFGISRSEAGLVITALQATAALMLFPSGHLSDSLSRSTVIVPSIAVLALGAVLIGAAPAYPVLLVGAATFGLGVGLFNIVARALISDHYSDRRGRALGVFSSGFSVGAILASAIAVLTFADWRRAFFAVAGALLVIGLVFVSLNREAFVLAPVTFRTRRTAVRLLTTSELRNPLLSFGLFGFAIQSFFAFFPAYLQDVKSFSPAMASAGFALLFAVGIASKLLAGDLSDRYSRRLVAAGGMLLASAALVGIIVFDSPVLLVAAIVVFALGHQAQFPLIDAIILDNAPASMAGGDLGAARTTYTFVGSLGPAFLGLTAEAYGYTVGFWSLLPVLLLSAAVLLVGRADAD